MAMPLDFIDFFQHHSVPRKFKASHEIIVFKKKNFNIDNNPPGSLSCSLGDILYLILDYNFRGGYSRNNPKGKITIYPIDLGGHQT